MTLSRFTLRPALAGLSLLLALLALGPTSARADQAELPDTPCDGQLLERPFLPWGDPASYTLVPGGAFEAGDASWQLSAGARIQDGNEPWRVRGASDGRSLALPGGASATSPEMCIGIQHPTLRFFARNAGPAASRLRVEVLYRDLRGRPQSLRLAELAAGDEWQPTHPIALLVNLLALRPQWDRSVAFRVTAQGDDASWEVDDVYVDPYHKG
jgi:hypothetical protein